MSNDLLLVASVTVWRWDSLTPPQICE